MGNLCLCLAGGQGLSCVTMCSTEGNVQVLQWPQLIPDVSCPGKALEVPQKNKLGTLNSQFTSLTLLQDNLFAPFCVTTATSPSAAQLITPSAGRADRNQKLRGSCISAWFGQKMC